MNSKHTESEAVEAVSTSEFSFIGDDKDNKIPQEDGRKLAMILADHDESSADKKKTTIRFFLFVCLASLIIFTGSSLMAFMLMKKANNGDVSSAAVDPESSAPPFNNSKQATPTENETDVDENPPGAPAFSPPVTLDQNTSAVSSLSPIVSPARSPAVSPILVPSASPTSMNPIIIYALGDLPYSAEEALGLEAIMESVPLDADFVIHVGDIRQARDSSPCIRSEYEAVRDLFRRSHAPVLLVMGDNEWNDCPNIDEGYRLWMKTFYNFEKEWPSSPPLQRWNKYPDAFHFVMRGVLFVGLNLVGGLVHDVDEWSNRLEYQYNSTRTLILEYATKYGESAKVVIIGHCDPSAHHRKFFRPFVSFVNDELENKIPLLYLNGDKHEWDLSYDYLGAPGLMRVMVVGGSKEAPIRIEINPLEATSDPRLAFAVQRDSYVFGR